MGKRYYTIFMLGTAGSGKTFLTKTVKDWFSSRQLDVATLNLDAGVKRLPYNPDIDVRDFINMQNIIDNFNLGPNGAMIASMDLIATKIDSIKSEIDYFAPEYLIVDTPGQIELFAYRSSGRIVSRVIAEESEPASVFLIDPSLARSAEGFASILLLSLSVNFQLNLPQVVCLSKSDIIEKEHKKEIDGWLDSPDDLYFTLNKNPKISMKKQLGLDVAGILKNFNLSGNILPISANTGENIDLMIGRLEREWGQRDDFYE